MAVLKDSGARRKFASGAVRDISEGKGRMDLMPLGEVAKYIRYLHSEDKDSRYLIGSDILDCLNNFIYHGDVSNIYEAISLFNKNLMTSDEVDKDLPDTELFRMLVGVSRQFEAGANKYSARNWEAGIDIWCYLDSGTRHLIKFLDGWEDEKHQNSFLWNMFGLLWTLENHPELNDLPYTKTLT